MAVTRSTPLRTALVLILATSCASAGAQPNLWRGPAHEIFFEDGRSVAQASVTALDEQIKLDPELAQVLATTEFGLKTLTLEDLANKDSTYVPISSEEAFVELHGGAAVVRRAREAGLLILSHIDRREPIPFEIAMSQFRFKRGKPLSSALIAPKQSGQIVYSSRDFCDRFLDPLLEGFDARGLIAFAYQGGPRLFQFTHSHPWDEFTLRAGAYVTRARHYLSPEDVETAREFSTTLDMLVAMSAVTASGLEYLVIFEGGRNVTEQAYSKWR